MIARTCIVFISYLFFITDCAFNSKDTNPFTRLSHGKEENGVSETSVLHLVFEGFEDDVFAKNYLNGLIVLYIKPENSESVTSLERRSLQAAIPISKSDHKILSLPGEYYGDLEIFYRKTKPFAAMVNGNLRVHFGPKSGASNEGALSYTTTCSKLDAPQVAELQADYICPSLDSGHPLSLKISLSDQSRVRWGISTLWWSSWVGVSVLALASSPIGLVVVGAARGTIFLAPIFKEQELTVNIINE